MPEKITYLVTQADDGIYTGTLVRKRLGVSASLLRQLKQAEDGITLDGVRVTVREKARAGQVLAILADAAPASDAIVPVEGALDIAYEDGHLLILRKPAGLAVHPSRGHYCDTLANRVAYYLQQKGEAYTFHAVNRIDKGTSGLLCLAKTKYAAQRLGGQLAKKAVQREYLALVCGSITPERGTVDLPIGPMAEYGIKRQVRPDGESAVTHYRTLRQGSGLSLLHLKLDTGRTHQIRVHMSHMGCPIVGDFMYGTELEGLEGHALHSCSLSLEHPVTGETVTCTAPMPRWYEDALQGRLPLITKTGEE